jgi:hypothetical protein
MVETLKTMGIDVPLQFPQLTYEQFKEWVTTGKRPTNLPPPTTITPQKEGSPTRKKETSRFRYDPSIGDFVPE